MIKFEKTPQVWLVSGNLGGGKTLTSVSMAYDALSLGYYVVSNVELNIKEICKTIPWADKLYQHITVRQEEFDDNGNCISRKDFNPFDILAGSPRGTVNPKRVLVILDECAEWFDQFSSQKDNTVKRVLSWLRHSSKRNQDVVFIVQRVEFLQKSFRILCSRYIDVVDLGSWRLPVLKIRLPFLGGYCMANTFDRVGTRVQNATFISKSFFGRFYSTAQNLSSQGHNATEYDVPVRERSFPFWLFILWLVSSIMLFFI